MCLAQETDNAHLKAKPLVGVSKVIQHDVDDGQLVNAGSVDLHHRPGIALLHLGAERREERERSCLKWIL